jgi:antitoxin component of MazEF toxin-antitoxin module
MVNRKIQFQNGSFFTVIPGALIDALELRRGDKVSFSIEMGKIIVTPVTACKQELGAASHYIGSHP